MKTNVFCLHKYGMRLRPCNEYDMDCQPNDGLVCVAEGGTVDGCKYYNFVYYIHRLDRETVCDYDIDYLGVKFLKAEEM